jgi:3-hydroxyacyl-CoA dehydrogenase / 3-hydroxy-2-methylbutyryl-CoA dehydrogenase
MDIKDGVAIITGGASGLGEATARYLLSKGAKVSILDFAQERGEKLSAELGALALFCKTDVTDEKSVQAAVDQTTKTFGAIHFAVNCAGVATPGRVLTKDGPMNIVPFNQVIQINLVGTMNVIRLAVEQMVKNAPNEDGEKGVVVNTASIAAFEGQFGQAAYAASKAGVVGMTLPIARECAGYGVRIMTIAPGIFGTPMLSGLGEKVQQSLIQTTLFPKRLGRGIEFALLTAHIIENPMLNGEVIRLDGGLRMSAK